MATVDQNQPEKGVEPSWKGSVTLALAAVLVLGGLLGFLVIPLAQGNAIGLSAFTAICRALGILPGTPAAPQPESTATAQPVSEVAWTPDILRRLGAGDREAGATAAGACAGCHGDAGVSPTPIFPNLAGQSALAIYKQLHDFRSGSRAHGMMSPIAQALDDQTIVNLAAYYASVTKGTLDPNRIEESDPATAEIIIRGDPARSIPACVSCHGFGAGGPVETPTLAGQHADYLAGQLRAYASGERINDVYGRMRAIAAALTEDEIVRLAKYYATTAVVR
jgi:cytochrome c553